MAAMASSQAIAAVLAFLQEIFPTRDINANTANAWSIMFEEWSDADLTTYARLAAKERGRKFFPTAPEVMACRPVPAIDSARILRQIGALGTYNPHGWLYPRIETVREKLGDGIADAYAAAGGERCFADEGSATSDIARRTFAAELTAAGRQAQLTPLLAANAAGRALRSGNGE
jgi:hypothetical protein